MDQSQPHTLQEKLARNVSLMGLSVGLTMLISLGLKMLLPRLMGPEKMGIFYFAESYATVFFSFLPLGFPTYINRTVPSNHDHVRDIFGSIIFMEVLMSGLIGLVMAASLYLLQRDTETLLTMLFMSLYAAAAVFQRGILHSMFLAMDRLRIVSAVNVLVKILLVAGCLLVFKLHPTIVAVAVMHSVSEIAGVVYLMYKSQRLQLLSLRPQLARMKQLLEVSLPFYLAGVLTNLFTGVDTNMLAFLSSNTEVGYFGSANKLIGVFLMLIPILQSSFTPALSRALQEGPGAFEKLFRQLLNFVLVCCLPLSIVLVLFGDSISRLLYGPGFEASYRILCYLAPVLIMMYINTFTGACLYLCCSGVQISRIFVIGILINVGLDYIAIPIGKLFGPGGPGLAVSFCTFLCETYTLAAMLRIFPSRVLDLKIVKDIIVILAPCWVGMLLYEPMIALNFWQRLGIAALLPFYALFTRLLTMADVRNFTSFLCQALLSRRSGPSNT